jgi:hypothetical protein
LPNTGNVTGIEIQFLEKNLIQNCLLDLFLLAFIRCIQW